MLCLLSRLDKEIKDDEWVQAAKLLKSKDEVSSMLTAHAGPQVLVLENLFKASVKGGLPRFHIPIREYSCVIDTQLP